MKTAITLAVGSFFMLLVSCSDSKRADVVKKGSTVDTASTLTTSAPMAESNLKAIMDSTMIRMGRLELSNNATKDFAMLMTIHHTGTRTMINQAVKGAKNPDVTKIAKAIEADLQKEMVQLNRFILSKKGVEQKAESEASMNLMKAMTSSNEVPTPGSNNSEKQEFPVLMISSLQTANDMVEVMDNAGAGYEISGFAQEMVARNNKYIEQLKELERTNGG